jgi:hypothetical protein
LITGFSDRPSVCREEEIVTVQAYRLLEAHQRIDEELRLESSRRQPDPFRLMRLKKLKLRIKDRLNGFMPKIRGGAR